MQWRSVFLISAALTAGVIVVLYATLKQEPQDAGLPSLLDHTLDDHTLDYEHNDSDDPASHALDQTSFWQACWAFATSGRFWLIGFSIVFLTVCMDFLNFIPLYLSEELDFSAGNASRAGTAFPLGMFAALLLTSFY